MKAHMLCSLILLTLFTEGRAQEGRSISIEAGGVGGLGAVSFETTWNQSERWDLVYLTGFSLIPIDRNNGTVLVFPQMVHSVYGEGPHQLDMGIGLAPSFTTTLNGAYVRMPLSIGYSLQPMNSRVYWRLAYTPLVSFLFDFQWQHWGGLTLGYRLPQKKDSP